MGRAVRAGITVSLLAGFLPSSSSLLALVWSQKGHKEESLHFWCIFPLTCCKNIREQRGWFGGFFLFFFVLFSPLPLVWQMLYNANSGGHLSTCAASHFPWGHTLPHISPRMICFCKWLDSSPAFTVQMQGVKVQQDYNAVTEGWECGGMDTGCTGGLAGQNAAAGLTAAQGSGQARKCFAPSLVSYLIPGRLEICPAIQHRNVLYAALAHLS